jgi:hypothetical protein
VSGSPYTGTIIFTYSRLTMIGSEFALIVHNTGTAPLPLHKQDLIFIGGLLDRADGTTHAVAQEVTPWQDTVPPGATVRNEFTLTGSNGRGDAVAVEWRMGGANGIRAPVQDFRQLRQIKPKEAC